MIVSHAHRFIFLRTRKTAGTSIEIALSTLVGADGVITAVSPRDEQMRSAWGGRRPQNHLRHGISAQPDLVRPGPADGVRFYNHMPAIEARRELGTRIWSAYFKFCFERNPWDKVVSLYYHRHRGPRRPTMNAFFDSGEALDCLNWPIYTTSGAVAADFVGRYERLADDLALALSQVHVPAPERLPRAKSQFRPASAGYRTELSERERERVAELFADE